MSARKLNLRCPECEAHLVLDAATGEVLFHKPRARPAAGDRDLRAMVDDLESEKSRAEDVFEREVEALKDRDRLLEEKFQEALKHAEESPDDEPPPRPFDFD